MSRTQRDRILEEAFGRSGEALERLLDERCAGNPALRNEIEQLLAIDARGDGDFLDRPEDAEPPRLEPSERVGRYVVQREIGRGGMSRVYEAEDTGIERLVALKILRPDDPADSPRFLQELRLLGGMQHDHIVRLYDFGEHRGSPYLVMELLNGETLADCLAAKHTGTLTRKFEIALQVAAAVYQMHDAGIVHLDIKPANVFLDSSGRAKLLDFGIAQHGMEAGRPRGRLAGTPAYLAPEQVQGDGPTEASDMYAYGVLLFELFTEERPFDGNVLQILALKLAGEPLPAAPLRTAGIPDGLRTLIAELTANNPAARPTIDLAIRELHAARTEAVGSTAPEEGHRRALAARQDVLDEIEREAGGRLAQSLQTPAPIATLSELQPHQVDSPWASEFRLPRTFDTLSSPDVFGVFTHPAIGGRLLLLGSAGAGKTTALLQLARELARRAKRDNGHPIPVLLNMAAWTAGRRFDAWLVDQLKRKYGIRKDRGSRWLRGRELTLLLDGLDELPAARQAHCVDAINQFLCEWRPPHVLVCSRLSEYENLGTRLQLNGAIRLMPFDDEQIGAYLLQAGCQSAWPHLNADPESLALARSPLFLHLLTVAEADLSGERWRRLPSLEERRTYLFDVYVQSLLARTLPPQPYTRHQVVRWLARLASILQRQGHTDFLIEDLQADEWLQSRTDRWLYRGTVAMVTAAVVLVGFMAVTYARSFVSTGPVTAHVRQFMTTSLPEVFVGPWLGTVLALAAGLIVAARNRIVPVETVRWSGAEARSHLQRWLVKTTAIWLDVTVPLGIAGGVLAAAARIWTDILGSSIWTTANSRWLQAGIVVGAASGFLAAAFLLRLRPGRWLVHGVQAGVRARWQEPLIIGVCGSGVAIGFGGLAAVLYGLGIALITGTSTRNDASAQRFFAQPIVAGLALTLMMGVITLVAFPLASAHPTSFADFTMWMPTFPFGGFGVGTGVALLIELNRRQRTRHTFDSDQSPQVLPVSRDGAWRWVRTSLIGSMIGIVPGLIGGSLWISGHAETVKNLGRWCLGLGVGQLFMIGFPVMTILTLSLALIPIGICGAAFGLLGGLTGPDVVRRATPNQGIRQSARNVPFFALIGVLVVGLPYGLINVAIAVALAGVVPAFEDWLVLGLLTTLRFGLLGALIPAAACIQHWTLRLILWRTGVAPWHYQRFLDHATGRKFLQRIGGRYRFVHPLLRDHFAVDGRLLEARLATQ